MKALVVYGSAYGNTQKVAKAIADGLGCSATHVEKANLQDVELVVVGSPTQGGRALKEIDEFLDRPLPATVKKAAAFDTRFDVNKQKLGLRVLMKTIGYAATKISDKLAKAKAKIIAEPEGFIVEDKEGPLASGELERAKKWGQKLQSL